MLPRGRRKAALQREQSQACLASVEREQARPKVKAVSGASVAAESYAPSQPLLRVHTIEFIINNKFNF